MVLTGHAPPMRSGEMRKKLLWVPAVLTMTLAARESLDDRLAAILAGEAQVPGIAAAAVMDGEIVAAGVAGIRKAGSPEKVEPGDLFHIGSCTKSMTACLASILVKDGKIRWESTTAELFPNLKIHENFRGATLRQLLSNTGGAPDDVPGELWARLWEARGPETKQRSILVRDILAEAPAYPPGGGYAYSNAGFSIAGAMLEKAAGKPFDELLTARLFKPLGMDSAGFGAPATPGKVDQPYGHHIHEGKLVSMDPQPAGDNPPAITPAGRVHCSILDLAKYARFHLRGLKGAPLTDEEIRRLHERVEPAEDYALGWVRAERPWAGGTALTHSGSNTMFYAVIWLAPERDFAAVAACNSGEGAKACDAAVAMMIGRYLKD